MSPSKWLGVIAASLAGAVAVACSSSSSSPPPDAGGSSSGTGSSSSGSSGGGSSSSSSGGVSNDGGGDAGSCQMSVTGFTPPAYVAAVGNQGVCSASDISAFVAACGSNGSQTMCNSWQNANVMMMEGGAGTACGNCVLSPMNNGGTWTDPNGFFQPNYAGCIQLTASTSGTMCAGALNNRLGCEGVACDSCSNATYQSCVTAADSTGCGQYLSAYNSACTAELADGGAVSTCTPGAASMNSDLDLTHIVTLICGGGDGGAPMDGGVTDAGEGG